jgi:hypothetical protein
MAVRQPEGKIYRFCCHRWLGPCRGRLYYDVRPILRGMESGERPKWKNIADRSPTYNSYWARWNSLVVRDTVKPKWESTNGCSKTSHIQLLRNKVKNSKSITTDIREGIWGVNKTLKVRERYY